LSDQSIEIGVIGLLNSQRSIADFVDGFVVQHESNIGMLQEGMGGQDGVVWLNNRGGDLRRWVDAEIELGLLSIIDRESFQEKRSESRSSSSSNRVEDQESLKASARICQSSDSIEGAIDKFLSNGVMTSSVIISGIFLSSQKLIGVEEFSISSSSDFIDNAGFEINKDCSRNVLSRRSFREESVKGIILLSNGGIRGHGSIRADSMFKAVQLPA